MEKLPKEIIHVILKNLPQKDLLNAARVNSTFNDVITSFKLIQKIYIKGAAIENPPTRFYPKAEIIKDNSGNFCKAFESIGQDIEEIYFNNLRISLSSIVTILNFLPNLKVISFYYVRVDDEDEQFEGKVQPLNNVNLIFRESSPVIFNLLEFVSINKIEMNFYGDTPYSDFRSILPFMKNQKELKSFAMSGIYESNLMYGVVPRGDFKLREFSISSSDLEEYGYLEEFLSQHFETLEVLKVKSISAWDCSNIIKSCRNLKSLTLHETLLDDLNESISTIEELSMKPPMENTTRFPNVKKLHLEDTTVEFNQSLSRTMQHVTNLSLKFGPAAGILMPNIVNLELMNVNQIEPEFFVHHNRLESLVLRNIFNLNDNLLEAMASNNGRSLKVLRIFGLNELSARALAIIKEHCKSLRVLEMATWSQQFKKDEWKCLYAINGLKIYTEKFDF